jgi:hypothetical protein
MHLTSTNIDGKQNQEYDRDGEEIGMGKRVIAWKNLASGGDLGQFDAL